MRDITPSVGGLPAACIGPDAARSFPIALLAAVQQTGPLRCSPKPSQSALPPQFGKDPPFRRRTAKSLAVCIPFFAHLHSQRPVGAI